MKRVLSCRSYKEEDVGRYLRELRRFAQEVGDEESFRKMERFFKALADSTRLRIIKMLENRELCVCEVMAALDLTQTNASYHLNMLERAGIVKKTRRGKWVFYSLVKPEVTRLIDQIS